MWISCGRHCLSMDRKGGNDMQGLSTGGGLAALAFWGFVAAVVVSGIWFEIRKREAQHETLRRVIESGQPIDQALADRIVSLSGGGRRRLERDLMAYGLVVLFAAPGLALLGVFVGWQFEAATLPILGVSAFVACIAIGLLVASKVAGRWYREDDASVS